MGMMDDAQHVYKKMSEAEVQTWVSRFIAGDDDDLFTSASGQEPALQCGERLSPYYDMIGCCQNLSRFLTLNVDAVRTAPIIVRVTIFLHQPG
jgi:hypothetical protein